MAAAKTDFDQSQVYFQKCRPLKIRLICFVAWEATGLKKKDFVQAEKCLTQAREIIHQENFQPVAVMGVLYWLELLPKARLAFCSTLGYKIALRAYFIFHPIAFL